MREVRRRWRHGRNKEMVERGEFGDRREQSGDCGERIFDRDDNFHLDQKSIVRRKSGDWRHTEESGD